MRKPMLSPGAKGRYAKDLIAIFPEHHTYVEPFAGSASIYFDKKPVEVDVLNDLDTDVMDVYRFIKEASDEDFKDFLQCDWTISQELWDQFASQEICGSLLESAHRSIYQSRGSFQATRNTLGRNNLGNTLPMKLEDLLSWRNRLSNTILYEEEATDTIDRYDQEGTVIFLDPPWPEFNPRWKHWTW